MSDEMLDYNVDTTVHFRLPDMSPEFNALAVSDLRKVFVEHVKSVFEKDETLGDSGYIRRKLAVQNLIGFLLVRQTAHQTATDT